jgi:hypothetical protein
MHFNFDFSAAQILWTLTFAGLLVLLVVLLGRDRARRFPWFTALTVVMALRMVISRLLSQRMSPIVFNEIFLGLYDLTVIVSLGVAIEISRRAFKGAGRVAWMVGSLVLLAIGGVIMVKWGPWPSWKTLMAGSELSALRLMQLFAQKGDELTDMLFIQLGLLVVFFGRSFKAGWRSHTQEIAIGLSTASITQAAIRFIWQQIALHTTIHSQDEYTRIMSLEQKFFSASNAVYLAVLLWWIACLWIDEPGSAMAANNEQQIADSGEQPAGAASAKGESSADPASMPPEAQAAEPPAETSPTPENEEARN